MTLKKQSLWSAPFIIWILIGTIVPLLAICYYGFTTRDGNWTFNNIIAIGKAEHARALWLAIALAISSTFLCFVLAYPIALILKASKLGEKGFIVFLFILPMWMNFLLRTMAWQVILEKGGLINSMIAGAGLPALEIINTPWAVILGMVYDFLPFMILPIYNTLIKIDNQIIEAAYDLGASWFTVNLKVILPLCIPGIASGVTMVFVPSLTTFVISNMLGGGKINLIGNIIEQEFTTSANWNLGSGLSLVMMVFIVVSMMFLSKLDKNKEGNFI
ncbi:MAG: ABC transporter permease [Clostridiales bacterium]|nr:ABC transporter permease [Clostridiales bacterium]